MMIAVRILLLLIGGACAGALTSAGYFAVVSSLGMINRTAVVTKTTRWLVCYEEIMAAGAILGNLWIVFGWRIPLGCVGIVLYGTFAGMFTGLFVVSLAETAKALPIFMRRSRIKIGLGWIILMIGVGKAVGHLLYYFVLYR